jgi:TonB family protein
MSSIPSVIASYLVNSVWEVTLVAGAGWLVSRMLIKLGPWVEHVIWVSTLGLAVLMPALPLLRWLLALLYIPHKIIEHPSIAFVADQSGAPNPESVYVLPAIVVLPLLSLYLSSLLYFAGRLAWSLHCTAILLREARSVSLTPQQDEIWRYCKRSFSLETARILSSRGISGPVTLGLRKPVLLMPVEFSAGCTSQDLFAALAHECAHIKRRDFQKNLFYEVTTLILAFHPIIWILKSYIAQTREMICDDMATERLIDSRSYSQSLLRLASMIAVTSRVSTSNAIGIFDANILEKRIMMMNIKKQRLNPALKYILIIPATLFLLSVAVGGAAMAVVIEPQSPSQVADQAKPYGHIYRIGKDVSAPVLISSKEPEFPESTRGGKDKFGGTCLIGLVVDSSGVVHDVHVKRSLRPDFDANAIKAVQQYRFTPATRSGEPVAVALSVEVNFKKF